MFSTFIHQLQIRRIMINKRGHFFFVLVLAMVLEACNSLKQKVSDPDFPRSDHPFLAQKPPGVIPEVFASRVVSTELSEPGTAFSPDKESFYFRKYDEAFENDVLIVIQYEDNRWVETFVVPSGVEISPDGKVIHIGNEYRERTPSGWSEVKSLGAPYSDIPIMRLTTSSKGTYFFDTSPIYDTTAAMGSIRYSRLMKGIREKPRTWEIEMAPIKKTHPFIAPDESYLIFDSRRENGNLDIYISYRQKDGSWGAAMNLGDKVNTDLPDAYGSVTSDGKYFFFTRFSGDGKKDLMWVDAGFIEALRPK